MVANLLSPDNQTSVINIMNHKYIWSKEDETLLITHYPYLRRETLLLKIPHIPKSAIRNKARKLKLKKKIRPTNTSFAPLLMNTPHIFYWIGFLLGDGVFKFPSYTIKLVLSQKDKNHVESFAKIINSTVSRGISKVSGVGSFTYYITQAGHKELFQNVVNKFDIKIRKTYNPPNYKLFTKFNHHLLLSLIIGFIDADGHIRPKCGHLKLENHHSWKNFLLFIGGILNEFNPSSQSSKNHIGKNSFELNVYGQDCLKKLKNFAITNRLPILRRKWDTAYM